MKSLIRKVKAALSRLASWYLERTYEGPEMPQRLADEITIFAHLKPSPEAWERFARMMARNAYQDGFLRGVDYEVKGFDPVRQSAELLEEQKRASTPLDTRDLRHIVGEFGVMTIVQRRQQREVVAKLMKAGFRMETRVSIEGEEDHEQQ